jgi:hypothetical protein
VFQSKSGWETAHREFLNASTGFVKTILKVGVTFADAALATQSIAAAQRSMANACRVYTIARRFFHALPTLHRTDREEIQRGMELLAVRIGLTYPLSQIESE